MNVGHAKPRREMFEACAAALGRAPETIIHIGDNERTDVRGALDAGFRAIRLDVVRDGGPSAAELVVYSLRLESQRALERELVGLSDERDAAAIYTRIENSHGLLRNCIQNSVVTLMQAFDRGVEGRAIFPRKVASMLWLNHRRNR